MTKYRYRVERWVHPANGEPIPPWKHREHHFDTLEEVDEYCERHKSVYELRVYKYKEKHVKTIGPTYEDCDIEDGPEKDSEEYDEWLQGAIKEWT